MQPDRVVVESKAKLPALWLVLLASLAILLPDKVWNVLLIGLGGLYVIAWYWARDLGQTLQAERRLKFGWVGVGDRLVEEFVIRKSGWLPALWVELQDDSNVPAYNPDVVRGLDNNSIRWTAEAICQQRGGYRLGPWRLLCGDPFGIFQVTYHYPVSDEIVIHPPIHLNLPITLPAGQSGGQVRAQERAWQAVINAAATRPYQPQDPYRWIHWRQTAHTGHLQVRLFDQDAAGDIWLLLDLQAALQLGEGRDSTEEHMVILAASLAAQALNENRAVGLAAYSVPPQVAHPSKGEGQQWRILRSLALLRANGEVNIGRSIQDVGRLAKRGSAVAVITPNGEADWHADLSGLTRQGIKASVILLDRPSFGGAGNSHTARDLIRRQNIACHIISKGELGEADDERQRQGFWEFKVTRTGKVFTIRTPYDR